MKTNNDLGNLKMKKNANNIDINDIVGRGPSSPKIDPAKAARLRMPTDPFIQPSKRMNAKRMDVVTRRPKNKMLSFGLPIVTGAVGAVAIVAPIVTQMQYGDPIQSGNNDDYAIARKEKIIQSIEFTDAFNRYKEGLFGLSEEFLGIVLEDGDSNTFKSWIKVTNANDNVLENVFSTIDDAVLVKDQKNSVYWIEFTINWADEYQVSLNSKDQFEMPSKNKLRMFFGYMHSQKQGVQLQEFIDFIPNIDDTIKNDDKIIHSEKSGEKLKEIINTDDGKTYLANAFINPETVKDIRNVHAELIADSGPSGSYSYKIKFDYNLNPEHLYFGGSNDTQTFSHTFRVNRYINLKDDFEEVFYNIKEFREAKNVDEAFKAIISSKDVRNAFYTSATKNGVDLNVVPNYMLIQPLELAERAGEYHLKIVATTFLPFRNMDSAFKEISFAVRR